MELRRLSDGCDLGDAEGGGHCPRLNAHGTQREEGVVANSLAVPGEAAVLPLSERFLGRLQRELLRKMRVVLRELQRQDIPLPTAPSSISEDAKTSIKTKYFSSGPRKLRLLNGKNVMRRARNEFS